MPPRHIPIDSHSAGYSCTQVPCRHSTLEAAAGHVAALSAQGEPARKGCIEWAEGMSISWLHRGPIGEDRTWHPGIRSPTQKSK